MRIVIVGVATVCLALAACSGGDGPDAVEIAETVPERTTVATAVEATEVSPTVTPTPRRAREVLPTVVAATPAQELVPTQISATPGPTEVPESTPEPPVRVVSSKTPTPMPERPRSASDYTFTPDPPLQELPDDVALIFMANPYDVFLLPYERWGRMIFGGPLLPLMRVYKRDGEMVKDVLFSEDLPVVPPRRNPSEEIRPRGHPWEGDSQLDWAATPDGSRIVIALCHDTADGCGPHWEISGNMHGPNVRTELYESTDGGVSWRLLDTLANSYSIEETTAGTDESDPQILLYGALPHDSHFNTFRFVHLLYPDGEVEETDSSRFAETGVETELEQRIRQGITDSGYPWILEYPWVLQWKVFYADGYSEDSESYFSADGKTAHAFWGWAIYNLETEETYLVDIPEHIFPLGSSVRTVAIQRGPFLLVENVDGCLPIRAGPSPDAEELACAAERVLLQDQGDVVTDEGVTWRKARMPAGVVGWADERYLE